MGDHANLQVLLAGSDFEPEEQVFMARLWKSVYGPERLIDGGSPETRRDKQALREKIHAELRLPGTVWDWRSISARELGGRHYYCPLDPLSDTMIPPFPRRFGYAQRFRQKYRVRPTWYALFSTPDRKGDCSNYLTTIGAARKQFQENFQSIWGLIFCAIDEEDFAALTTAAPPGSAEKKLIERVFERFPFTHYLEVLEFLADDWGRDALIELDFWDFWQNSYGDTEKMDMVETERASASRIFEALRRLDIAALRGEVLFEPQASSYHGAAEPWFAPYSQNQSVDRFQRYLFEEPDW